MISNGEVISRTLKIDEFTEAMLGSMWWAKPEYDWVGWWDAPYPARHKHIFTSGLETTGGVMLPHQMDSFLAVMTQGKFSHSVGH